VVAGVSAAVSAGVAWIVKEKFLTNGVGVSSDVVVLHVTGSSCFWRVGCQNGRTLVSSR
jgi:hypothetical protein